MTAAVRHIIPLENLMSSNLHCEHILFCFLSLLVITTRTNTLPPLIWISSHIQASDRDGSTHDRNSVSFILSPRSSFQPSPGSANNEQSDKHWAGILSAWTSHRRRLCNMVFSGNWSIVPSTRLHTALLVCYFHLTRAILRKQLASNTARRRTSSFGRDHSSQQYDKTGRTNFPRQTDVWSLSWAIRDGKMAAYQ